MSEAQPFRLFPAPTRQHSRLAPLLAGALDLSLTSALGLRRCARLYQTIRRGLDAGAFAAQALDRLGVEWRAREEEIAGIPREGACVIVANHPFGGIDGLVLITLLSRVRPDVKVLANPVLGRFPELAEVIIPVSPFETPRARRQNVTALRAGHAWLASGGMLVVFPAGEVSHFHLQAREVMDPQWQTGVARLVRRNGAPVVPVFFPGSNGMAFQAAGLLHRRLRTVLLPRQLLNKHGAVLDLKIGETIPVKRLKSFTADRDLVDYLRLRTCLLAEPTVPCGTVPGEPAVSGSVRLEPLAPEVPARLLAGEIAALPAEALLHSHGDYQVWVIRAGEGPYLLTEIGRLRELTFRGHGEGTGHPIDLDRFDAHYLHLFMWNRAQQEIVGAYRIGTCDEILHEHGVAGLYTSTLFHYRRRLFTEVGPALELGRSFVRPEYQKSFAPLLLLWQGIGAFLVRNPRYRTLFGPVSISREYRDLSRQLIASSLMKHMTIPALARLVTPKAPVSTTAPRVRGCPPQLAETFAGNIEQLNAVVADLEADHKGLPVLLRHYLNLGGKLLAFNLDEEFSDVVDGLILVDLDRTERKMLERYLGKEGAAFYLAHAGRHAIRPAA